MTDKGRVIREWVEAGFGHCKVSVNEWNSEWKNKDFRELQASKIKLLIKGNIYKTNGSGHRHELFENKT